MADAAQPTGDSAEPSAGSLNTRYLLETVLASGAHGAVHRGHDSVLDRPVAVKVLRAPATAAPEDEIAFLQQARAAAALKHPQIVELYDAGIEDDRRFVVMEYIEGPTLRDVIAREAPLTATRAAEIVALVADALDMAHRRGAIHGDLKPGNIMLPTDDQPKIIDFGIASIYGASRDEGDAASPYVAPEVARGLPVDGRADIYALATVLRELVTGQPARPAADPAAATTLALPPDAAPGLLMHPQMLAIIERGTAPDRDRRFATAAELALALRGFTIGQQAARAPAPPPPALLHEPRGPAGPLTEERTVVTPLPLDEPTVRRARPPRSEEDEATILGLPSPARRRRFPWASVVATGLVVTLLTAGGVLFAIGAFDRGPRLVTVPGVERQRLDAAAEAVRGAGLTVAAPIRFVENREPFGTVVSQAPAAGSRLRETSQVELTVSLGAP